MSSQSKNKYFAAQESKETARIVLSKATSFYDYQTTNGWLQKIMTSWRAYYGAYYDGADSAHTLSFGGEQGEYVQTPVNHYRNIGQHLLVMTTSSRPSMDARATNTDYKSQVQTILANGILDYYMREKQLEYYIKTAVEYAIVMGAGFIKMEWDSLSGEVYEYETSPVLDEEGNPVLDENGIPLEEDDPDKPLYEGDVKFTNLSPFDVVFDSHKEDQNHDWVITRTFKNKYDLAAKYSELSEKIVNLQTKSDNIMNKSSTSFQGDSTDDVPVYEFYHRRSEALPRGRHIIFLSDDIILHDGDMPYRRIPVIRVAPSDLLGTPYGYTPMFDLLPLQEAVNGLYSTIMTNQSAFGVQNIYVPRGADITLNALEGGLNIIEGNSQAGVPTPLNLTQTPKEIFEFLVMLVRDMETLSGVNSVARGNPEASLKSGTSLALVQSLALQFASNLQHQYIRLIEQVGTNLIQMLQDFATTKRTVSIISGVSQKAETKEFDNDDISNISRVMVDVGNPLARTTSGKLQLASELLQYNMIKEPSQYLSVINTGKLEVATEDTQKENLLIRAENEKLINGMKPTAIAIEDHVKHIKGHQSVLYDPELKEDSDLVANTLAHIQEHLGLLESVDPRVLMILGQQPMPQMVPPQGEIPPEGQQGGAPQAPAPAPQGTLPDSIQLAGSGETVSLPSMPTPPEPFDQNQVILPT